MKIILLLIILIAGCPEYEISIKPAKTKITDKMVKELEADLPSGSKVIAIDGIPIPQRIIKIER